MSSLPPTFRRLTDDQLSAIHTHAGALRPDDRDDFTREVIAALGSLREVGPGTVFRVAGELQGKYLSRVVGFGGDRRATPSKYARGGGRGKRA